MNKGLKLLFAVAMLAAIIVPVAVSAKPEARPEVASGIKAEWLIAAKPEAKPEAG